MSEANTEFTREYAADKDMQAAYQMGIATVLQYGVAVRPTSPTTVEGDPLEPTEHVLHLPVGIVEKIEPQMVPTFDIQDDLILTAERPDDAHNLTLYVANALHDRADVARIGEPTEERHHWGAFLHTMRTTVTISDDIESPEAGREITGVRVFDEPFYPYQAQVLNNFLRKLAQRPPEEVIRDRIDLTGMTSEEREKWCQERLLNKELGMSVVASSTQQEHVHKALGQLAWQWGEGSEPDKDTTLSEVALSTEKLRERVPHAIRLLRAAGQFKIGVFLGECDAATTVVAQWDMAHTPVASQRSIVVRSSQFEDDRVTSVIEEADGVKEERSNGLRNLEAQALLEISGTLQGLSEEEMDSLRATTEDREPQKLSGVLYGKW